MKKLIVCISVIIVALITFFTVDVIRETQNWEYFNIDFKGKPEIISAYSSLLSGLLGFLSILFVIYQIDLNKEYLDGENKRRDKEDIEEKRSLLKLVLCYSKGIRVHIEQTKNHIESFLNEEREDLTRDELRDVKTQRFLKQLREEGKLGTV